VASGARGPVLVVGGGIVGVSCAWFLRRAGADVTVLEAGEACGGGASRGNAGLICPSLTEPLPGPGAIRDTLTGMFGSAAPLHVRPASAPRMASFLARFAAAAGTGAYRRGASALSSLARGVMGAYDELEAAGIGVRVARRGYLLPYRDADDAVAEHGRIERIAALGVCATPEPLLTGEELRAAEPLLSPGMRVGFVVPGEGWVDPSALIDAFVRDLRAAGVRVVERAGAIGVREVDGEVEVDTAAGTFGGRSAVLAAGAWTSALARPFGLRPPIVPGKGYSFSLRVPRLPARAMHLHDAHVAATPIGDVVRIAGTMEFDGTIDRFNPGRVRSIVAWDRAR
jgi:D-amino-acid dehydrogenase